MNLPHRLLKFFSFRFEKRSGKDQLPKLLTLIITSSIISIYFFVLAIISLITFNLFHLILSAFAFILFIINVLILSKGLHIHRFYYLPIILPALIFQFFLWTGSITGIGTLIIAFFPLITIGLLGYNKGFMFSLIFAAVSAVGLFVPLEINQGYQLDLIFKINFLLSFLTVTSIAYFFELINQHAINEAEKQVLDQKNAIKLKEQFIANLSHQIRTPLNNIMVISSILESAGLDEKQKDMIDTIHASTNNLVNVVNSMVEISNVDLKERGDFYVPFNLRSTIQGTIRLFSSQYSTDTSFTLKIDESIPETLSGDPVKIKQIFLNLIESILKNKSSGKTVIYLMVNRNSESSEEVALNFEINCNRPILLPMNEGRSLFVTNETIYTSASTMAYIELLDLAITQKLIESNGGRLFITLSPQDAVFNFTYTLRKASNYAKADTAKTGAESDTVDTPILPRNAIELDQANVLLVEDNLINQKIVVLSLKKLVRNIEIANNGKEALDKVGTNRFDIILMDIQMPIMNGFVTTKKIRELEASSNTHTPIIAITANALLGDKEECLASGMDDYISKPFQIEVLIQKMKNLLKSKG